MGIKNFLLGIFYKGKAGTGSNNENDDNEKPRINPTGLSALEGFGIDPSSVEQVVSSCLKGKKHVVAIRRDGSVISGYEFKIEPKCRLISQSAAVESLTPVPYLDRETRFAWIGILAAVEVTCIRDGDPAVARVMLKKSKAFLLARALEAARRWHVMACGLCVAIAVSLYWIVGGMNRYLFEQDWEPGDGLFFGAVGAVFFLLMRLDKIRADPAAGRKSHFFDVFARVSCGALAGWIVVIAILAKVLGITVEVAGDPYWSFAFLAFLAGYSERFVPYLLRQLELPTDSDVGKPDRIPEEPDVAEESVQQEKLSADTPPETSDDDPQ